MLVGTTRQNHISFFFLRLEKGSQLWSIGDKYTFAYQKFFSSSLFVSWFISSFLSITASFYQRYLEMSYSSPWFGMVFRWPMGHRSYLFWTVVKAFIALVPMSRSQAPSLIKSAWDSAQMVDRRVTVIGKWV